MTAMRRIITALVILVAACGVAACASSGGPTCSDDDDCDTGEVCDTDQEICMEVSTEPCEDDGDCPSGHICDDDICVEDGDPDVCDDDGDCDDGQTCDDGDCVDKPDECTFHEDCDDHEICDDGSCIDEPDDFCLSSGDCPGDEICEDNTCVEDENDDPDPEAPTVEHVEPGHDETGVSVDTQIRIHFDQDMNPTQSTHPNNLRVIEHSTNSLREGQREYLDDEREILVTFDDPLAHGTEYTIVIDSPESLEGRAIDSPVEKHFTTEWSIDEDIEQLAERFAPVIYQGVDAPDSPDTDGDIPTAVDFDGNLDAADNLENAQSGNYDQPAQVYYSHSATETHHFLHYLLYYPFRDDAVGIHDHDFVAIAVIVDRDDENVRLVDAITPGGQDRMAYRPDDLSYPENANGGGEPEEIDPATLEDGQRFPLYIPDGAHAACYWYDRQSGVMPADCDGEAEKFVSGQGFVMRPGDAQTFDEATDGDDGHAELTYGLEPFIDPFWLHLSDRDSNLYTGSNPDYDVDETRPLGPFGKTLQLRSRLDTGPAGDDEFGYLPFIWAAQPDNPSGGAWILDPAWRFGTWYEFGGDYSQSYCYNFFFDIDRRSDTDCED